MDHQSHTPRLRLPSRIAHKRAKNSIAPISRLHPEILAEIFTSVAGQTYSFQDVCKRTPPYQWLRITHVCHSWREIALASPRVWSYLRHVGDVDCVKAMLARSKEAPLFVDFGHHGVSATPFALIADHVHRMHTLDMPLSSIGAEDYTNLRVAFPRLTELSLRDTFLSPMESRARTIAFLESCDMPRLTCLQLFEFSIPWRHQIFRRSSLTHLLVHVPEHFEPPPIIFEDLLHVLRASPLLERLDLARAIMSVPMESRTSSTIRLRHLRALTLSDEPANCTRLLRRLAFPHDVKVSLDCSWSNSREDARALGGELSRKLDAIDQDTGTEWPHVASLAIKESNMAVHVQCWDIELTIEQLKSGGLEAEQRPEEWVKIDFEGDDAWRTCCALADQLSLSAVRSFYIEISSTDLVVPDLFKIATRMPYVHALGLSLRDHDWDALVSEALGDGFRWKPARKELIFPHLSILHLSDVAFRPNSELLQDNQIISKYHRMLAMRSREIQKFVLHQPINLFEQDTERWATLVEEVIWDPQHVTYGDEDTMKREQVDLDLYTQLTGGFYGDLVGGNFHFN